MNEIERWIYLDGPEPERIRPLLDALRDLPPATPQDRERMARAFFAASAECGTVSHPIDVVTGRVFTHAIELLALPGALPFVWERSYSSAMVDRDAGLGWRASPSRRVNGALAGQTER